MANILISGVSSGIGLSLAKLYLGKNYKVYGLGRKCPNLLNENNNFTHCKLDYIDNAESNITIKKFLNEINVTEFEVVFLNAGQFSERIATIQNTKIIELDRLININVWSHKILLDCLLDTSVAVSTVFVSSSIAGVRARAGNSSYAITKSMLNMLINLYAAENKSIYFSLTGLCNVKTKLSEQIGTLVLEGHFPEQVQLRERAKNNDYLSTSNERALHISKLLNSNFLKSIPSGNFFEIRDFLKSQSE